MFSVVVCFPPQTHEPSDPEKHMVLNTMVKRSNISQTYLIPSRKTTKLMLPCVIGFQEATSYLSSSGKPMKLATMLKTDYILAHVVYMYDVGIRTVLPACSSTR